MSFPKHPKVQQNEKGDLFLNFGDYGQEVEVACFSGDGKRVLTVQEVGIARIWDVASNSLIVELQPTSPLEGSEDKAPVKGGFQVFIEAADTWEWNGKKWTQVETDGFGARSFASAAYDEQLKLTVLFGGQDEKQFSGETWGWNGKKWQRIATEGPPRRIQFIMGYDSSRKRTVLFGGFGNPPEYLNDLWEFDGIWWMKSEIKKH